MGKISLLVVSNAYPANDKDYFGIFVQNQVKRLKAREKMEVECCCSTIKAENLFEKLKKYFLITAYFLPKFFKNYHIINVHFPFPTIYLAYLYKLFHPGVRVVTTFHGSDIRNYPKNIVERILGFSFKYFVDHSVAVSSAIKREIDRKLNFDTAISVLSAGVDFDKFHPENKNKSLDLLFVGSFTKVKGFDLFIEAIREMDVSLEVLAVGEGELEERTPSLLKVHEPVEQSKLCGYYNSTKMLVVPSREEAFGLVACEALACGIPVVAARVGGLKEIIVPSINGLFFSAGDKEQLKSKLRKGLNLCENSSFAKDEEIRETVKAYSFTNVIDKQIDIYKKLLTPNKD